MFFARFLILVAVLFSIASCGTQSDPNASAPVARLDAPKCIVSGSYVSMDASESSPKNGIERYAFQIGHDLPIFMLAKPYLKMKFNLAIKDGDQYQPIPIQLTITSENGATDDLDNTHYLWVMDSEQDCIDAGMIATPYRLPDEFPDTFVEPDTFEFIDVNDNDSGTPGDILPIDTAHDNYLYDYIPPDDVGGLCIDVSGTYQVQVFQNGQKFLELELELLQDGCDVTEAFGIVAGTTQGSNLKLESDYIDLHMASCSGNITDLDYFELDCTDGWSVSYTRLLDL